LDFLENSKVSYLSLCKCDPSLMAKVCKLKSAEYTLTDLQYTEETFPFMLELAEHAIRLVFCNMALPNKNIPTSIVKEMFSRKCQEILFGDACFYSVSEMEKMIQVF
ncbi:hypothetical protein PMAYCL1PPCAC_27794, partial [Pristionchus mayeri]